MLIKVKIIKSLIALFLFLGQGSSCLGQTQDYKIDLVNSSITFKVSHMGVLTVNGEFQEFSGILYFNDQQLMSLESSIVVESIHTKDKLRDATLKGEGYLDVEKFPLISFISTNIKATSASKTIIGILNIKGAKKKILMPYRMIESENNDLAFIKISTLINRKDFRLDFGPIDVLIGNNIRVELKIAFSKS